MNTTLGGGGPLLLVPGAFAVANLTTLRTNLQTAITAVEAPRNTRQNAATDRDLKKAPLLERLRQFRARVATDLAGSTYEDSAPIIPTFAVAEGVFMKAMDDMQSLWVQINAAPPSGFTAPMKLVGGYDASTHLTDITALRTTYQNFNVADQTVGLRLHDRDALLVPLRARLVQYRKAVPGRFAAGDSLILSLPRVTPLPGSTPHAVVVTVVWNETTGRLEGSWDASTRPDLKEYQLRSCDPPKYRVVDESPVATIAKTETSFSLTGAASGLGSSMASKIFCLYVVTNDDNEKGSNKVHITRP